MTLFNYVAIVSSVYYSRSITLRSNLAASVYTVLQYYSAVVITKHKAIWVLFMLSTTYIISHHFIMSLSGFRNHIILIIEWTHKISCLCLVLKPCKNESAVSAYTSLISIDSIGILNRASLSTLSL